MTRLLLLAGVCIFTAEAGNQVLLRNLNSADGTPQVLAADRGGHLFVISTFTAASGHLATRVVELDLNGSRLASLDIPDLFYLAAATDYQGNLIVTGVDASSQQGTILKLDPQLHGTVFLRSLPGYIEAVAVDASGNIYVTGTTSSASFPVTAGAYQTTPPRGDYAGTAAYAFLTEISAANQLLYSTYFGGNGAYCTGGSACIGVFGRTTGTAIAVDSSGALVIAGSTDAADLPTTVGSLAPTCRCSNMSFVGFIAKFQPGASQQLQWSTFLNVTWSPYPIAVSVKSMALDAAGNVIVGGSAPAGLPTTPGTIQPSIIPDIGTGDSGGFLVKLNNTGTAVIWGTYFGNSPFSRVKALRVDAQGRVLFTGVTANPSAPSVPNNPSFRQTYVARMASDATSLADYYQGPLDVVGQDLVLTAAGGFAAVGRLGTLWIETTAPGPSLLAVTNTASGQYSSAVAPYELITLYGVGIGPQTSVSGQVQNDAFTSSLGGCRVLFDGVAAPLLYADSGQINVVVPRAVYMSTHVQVVTPTGTVDGPTVPVSFQPGIFQNSQTGFAAALNQDGSVNSPSNPAKSGAIAAVFATGGGASFSFADGALVPAGIYNASTTVWAGNQRSFEVVFAGDAPGLVAGVMQINFRVPDSLPPGNTLSFSLIIGGVSTSQNRIAVVP